MKYNGTVSISKQPWKRCRALVDTQGRILDTAAVSCVFRGTPRFHDWFVQEYGPVNVIWKEEDWEFERRWEPAA